MIGIEFSVLLQAVDEPQEYVRLVQQIESLGFRTLWVADSSLHARDVYVYLTLAAVSTERIGLGTGIAHPLSRHPAVTLNALVTLDVLSGGRVTLGVGSGDRPLVELGLNPAPVAVTEEMIHLIRQLESGDSVTFSGARFATSDARVYFPSDRRLPMYIAGSGPKILGLAGRMADGVLIQVGVAPECLRYALERVAAGAIAAGRNLKQEQFVPAAVVYGSIQEDRQRAMDDARPFAAWMPQTVPRYCDIAGIPRSDVEAVRSVYRGGELHEAKEAAATTTPMMIEKFTLAGTGADCRVKVQEMIEVGIRHIVFVPMGRDRVGDIKRFAHEIIPYFDADRPTSAESGLQ